MKKYVLHPLSFLLLLTAIMLFCITLPNPGLMGKLFSHAGYYFMLILFLLWIIILFEYIRSCHIDLKSIIWSNRYGIIFSIIFTAFIFISVEPTLRILSDETNLLAVSHSMVYEKTTDNITMGKWYYDTFHRMGGIMTPKRPLLFPFLIQIIHSFSGYRAENAFVLNFILLFSLLLLIYSVTKKALGEIWALSALILVASQPIVAQTATSAGFDLCAAVFMMTCFISLKSFFKAPSSIRFQFLLVNLLILVNVRHEGIMAFVIVMGALLVLRYIKIEYFKSGVSVIYFLAPNILLLTLWQRCLIKNQFETSGTVFSIKFFIKNNIEFLKDLFDYRFFLPYAAIVDFIGFIALIYFICSFIASYAAKKEKWQNHLAIISALCLFANWIMFTSYYNGELNHPTDSRYYVLFFVLLSVAAIYFLNVFKAVRKKAYLILMLSLAFFLMYNAVSVNDGFSRMQTTPRKNRFVTAFLKKEAVKSRNFLVITDRPGQLIVYNYGAVSFEYARTSKLIILDFHRHLVENIYVIQDIMYSTKKPLPAHDLGDKFVLEKLVELEYTPEYFVRISRVTDIKQ